jgi:hypothetical protein
MTGTLGSEIRLSMAVGGTYPWSGYGTRDLSLRSVVDTEYCSIHRPLGTMCNPTHAQNVICTGLAYVLRAKF